MDWPRRWYHSRQVLENGGPFAHSEFQPTEELWKFIQENLKVLIIGAGGLGCELLKDLALMGFRNMEVIDMDTIDISNLNRQFLFRTADVGKDKASVAANFINKRVPGANVTPHCAKIQDFDSSFYKGFNIVVNGLDSIVARRWINGMLLSCLQYEDDSDDGERGMLDPRSIIPMVDGGTEGFRGNVRVVLPGMSACLDCTLDLYPPQVNFPMCTIAHTPRLPEHCIEYVRVLQWPKDNPWGEEISIDGDDPDHIQWIFQESERRANEFNITGVTYRLTQGVVKRIIPAVASTNAVIAAACSTEVFKIATMCAQGLNNFMNFNDAQGVYNYTYEAEKRDDCLACSQRVHKLTVPFDAKLREVIEKLTESAAYQMKSPGITCNIGGKNKTLYMPNIKSIEERTKDNLKKTLSELGIVNDQEIYVADPTSPSTLTFKLNLVPRTEA